MTNIEFDNIKLFLPNNMEEIDNEDFTIWENNTMVIQIECIELKYESENFQKDIKFAAKEIAEDMFYKEIKEGDRLKLTENSFYVFAETNVYEKTGTKSVICAIHDKTNDTAYEISIDCLNNKIDEALKILNSIEFK
ncbi:MAG: hypothetical protein N4A49_07820 [Marinifilaceae bacterium]|jgi:hypothetical protein|nr:hypothetical protein [Marinifilaceae bacterium]